MTRDPKLSGAPFRACHIRRFAKSIAAGLPLSGVIGKAEIMDAPGDSAIGGTYVGNPVAQAAALAVLDVFEEEGLSERAGAIGETIRTRMRPGRSAGCGRRRARARSDARDRARSRPRDEGAGAGARDGRRRGAPPSAGCFCSSRASTRTASACSCPLVITDAELDEALDVWEQALDALARLATRGTGTKPVVVGELIADRYELEELVGTGGMSSVYRAHDRLLERDVALKVLHEQFSPTSEHVERFRREARAVAQLSHPNIVTVIDRGEQDGRQYIVFEYVDGENLKELVERGGPLPVRARSSSRSQVARALALRARAGARPSRREAAERAPNDGGQAKVTDFGIARSLDVQSA